MNGTIVSLAAAIALLAAVAEAQEPKRGGALVIGTSTATTTFNNAIASGAGVMVPGAQIFASPLLHDADWNPKPYLAEKWETSADGLSVTLNLRRDALFHDGRPITSEDVAFSILTIRDNHPFNTMLAPVERVDTPDPATAIIRLKHPHPALIYAMGPPLMPILPKHIYGDGRPLKTHPQNNKDVVGSGPFRLAEFKPGDQYVLERFTSDLVEIPGVVPSVWELQAGCPFADRCAEVAHRCRIEMPPSVPVALGHRVACWQRPERRP